MNISITDPVNLTVTVTYDFDTYSQEYEARLTVTIPEDPEKSQIHRICVNPDTPFWGSHLSPYWGNHHGDDLRARSVTLTDPDVNALYGIVVDYINEQKGILQQVVVNNRKAFAALGEPSTLSYEI